MFPIAIWLNAVFINCCSGGASELVTGYYAWCRGGLRGQDYNGDEINTGQPQ